MHVVRHNANFTKTKEKPKPKTDCPFKQTEEIHRLASLGSDPRELSCNFCSHLQVGGVPIL